MDAHYHQVMKKREEAQATGTRLYFAYSTILDMEAFKEWAEQHSYQFFKLPAGQVAKVLDHDLVFDFASRWWGGLVAGLTEKNGAEVYGMLFEIPNKDWPVVQHKEGFITQMCIEKEVKVQILDAAGNATSQQVTATAFVTNPQRAQTQGEISKNFIHAIIQGAKASRLPSSYIQKLEGYLK